MRFLTYQSYQAENKPAWIAGFADAGDMETAQKAGFGTADDWHREMDRRADVRAKQQVAMVSAAAEAKSAEETAKRVSNERFQIAVRAAIALRESMKNPDSFKLERVSRMQDGSLCFSYRAANSFNAIIPGQAVFSPLKTAISGSEAFPMLWSKYCKGYGEEIKNVAYALTYYPRK